MIKIPMAALAASMFLTLIGPSQAEQAKSQNANAAAATIAEMTIGDTSENETAGVVDGLKEMADDMIDQCETAAALQSQSYETTCKNVADVQEQIRIRKTAATTPSAFRRAGEIRWNGWRWTWYSERVLPGGGLNIPGRYTDKDGFVCDEDGYICLASGSLKRGTVVDTPFGREGKVYDCGCAANTLDVYVNW